jgi:hypothetical protein
MVAGIARINKSATYDPRVFFINQKKKMIIFIMLKNLKKNTISKLNKFAGTLNAAKIGFE